MSKFWQKQQVASITAAGTGETHSCGCVGPQNGEPLCPCKMRGVEVINGRYVIPAQDLGPARLTAWDHAYAMMRRTAAEPPRAIRPAVKGAA